MAYHAPPVVRIYEGPIEFTSESESKQYRRAAERSTDDGWQPNPHNSGYHRNAGDKMLLDRRQFLRLGAGSAVSALSGATARKPNILVILADDMGYSDAGCYGGDIDTPNLDSLASNGLRYTQAYSTARCGPSRGCILTGYYAQQTASDVMTPGNIPSWTHFVPEYLKPL